MSRFVPRGGVALLVAATLASCATLEEQQSYSDPFEGASGDDIVLVTVHNYDRRAATIYAYWNGLKVRVGTVMSSKTETFRIKWRAEEVQLGYEFIGRRAVGGDPDWVDGYRSEVFYVTEGDHLDFVIQATG